MRRTQACIVAAALVGSLPLAAAGEIFHLANGGTLQGKLLNPEQAPRELYLVELASGGKLALTKEQVRSVETKSAAELAYERLLPQLPDTLEAHWDMAHKCAQANMEAQRQFHLEQVLRHDPNHEEARRLLGYRKVEGQWIRTDEWMQQQGYVKYSGSWRTRQEVELLTQAEQREEQENAWRKKVLMWRSWIVRQRGDAQQAEAELRAIDDPHAAPALIDLLKEKDEPLRLRRLYIEILGKLRNPAAIDPLVELAVTDNDESTRDLCLEQLKRFGTRQAIARFTELLKHNENLLVQRAAVGLGRLGASEATLELIEALVTTHRRVSAPQSGSIGASFGSNGLNGFSAGGRPQVLEQQLKNDQVLAALASMHPGVNFAYDETAWKAWYIARNTPKDVNFRRSE